MAVSVDATSYGAAAYQALAAVVASAKAGDPLAPVTLVVPGERVGVAARRVLARGVVPGRAGVAGLRVLTMRRLAESLAGERFARSGRRPLTGPVLAAAVRGVLRSDGGMFAPVAGHIGTVRAIAGAHRLLRTVPDAVLGKFAGANVVSGEAVRVHRAVEQRCATGFFDEVDLLEAAAATVGESGVRGSVVVFLPQDLEAPEIALLAAVGRVAPVRVVLGLTGDVRADEGPRAVCRALGVDAGGGTVPPVGDVVMHASDPDDEVRCVVRRVVGALVDRPGHRVGVFYGAADPYARLVHEHLARTGIAVFGRGVRPTAEGRLGRSVLRLLGLRDTDFARSEVLAFIADAPVRHAGGRAPSSAWERVSRTAGVVRGDDWIRLQTYADGRDTWLADHPDGEAWRVDRARREAAVARALHAFVTEVRSGLFDVERSASWREMGEAALRLWVSVLGGDEVDNLAPEERRAAERISATLRSLSGLDTVAGEADPVLLRELLELDLSDDLDRVGRTGTGVHVGPVSEGVGEDLDLVFVLGAAEGMLPARAGEDPLLPDDVRELTEGALPTVRERVARQHRQVLAALAAAPSGGRVLSFPRGDLRRGGSRVVSRWLVPTLTCLAGRDRVRATQWASVPGLVGSPSYAGSVHLEGHPATGQEWRQRAAVDHHCDTPPDPVLARALEVRRARAGGEFTVFDGNLAGETLPDPTDGPPVSATALEGWVHCPHGYFLKHLLRVAPIQQPEEVVRISPMERGTVLHDVWERVVTRAIDEGWVPGPGQPWPARSHRVVAEAARERFARAEAEGVTGFALLWELDKKAICADLAESIGRDDMRRLDFGGLTPIAAEWSFDGAEFDLGDGRILRLTGRVDRIDRIPNGMVVVTDYKTGKPGPFRAVNQDSCDRGQRLQLVVYAVAAQAEFGDRTGNTTVRSEYWFATRRGGFERIGHTLDQTVVDRARLALRTIVNGIAGGMFLARPNGTTNALYACPGCDLDGDAGVSAAWQRKAHTPELAALRDLLGENALP
jgi:ATP-dependent helicase/nuclease subunit B